MGGASPRISQTHRPSLEPSGHLHPTIALSWDHSCGLDALTLYSLRQQAPEGAVLC